MTLWLTATHSNQLSYSSALYPEFQTALDHADTTYTPSTLKIVTSLCVILQCLFLQPHDKKLQQWKKQASCLKLNLT